MPTEALAKAENVRENLEETMINSKLVSLFIKLSSGLPGQTLGFVQDDFSLALNILKASIEGE